MRALKGLGGPCIVEGDRMSQSLLVRGDRSQRNYARWKVRGGGGTSFRGGGGDRRKRDTPQRPVFAYEISKSPDFEHRFPDFGYDLWISASGGWFHHRWYSTFTLISLWFQQDFSPVTWFQTRFPFYCLVSFWFQRFLISNNYRFPPEFMHCS